MPPTLVRKHEKDVEDLKSDGRHGEEVHRDKALQVVLEESPPGLGRRLAAADEVVAHARLADVDAELQKLAVNTRRTPARILFAHAADEIPNIMWDRRPPSLASPNLPRPEEAKCVAVPGNDCFGLDNDQRRSPVRPDAGQPDPQETVGWLQPWALLRGALQDADLMPERNILQLQRSAGFQD